MEKTTKQLLIDLTNEGKSQHEISRGTKIAQATLSRILSSSNKTDYSRHHGKVLAYYREIFPTKS